MRTGVSAGPAASTGRLLQHRYELGPLVGRGGMADVFLCRDRVLNRRIAVKSLRPHLATSPLLSDRFRQEARTTAGLNHPSIATVHDMGTDVVSRDSEGVEDMVAVPFFVMEYVDGGSLRDILRLGEVDPHHATRYVRGVLTALDFIHHAGVVHRDIKPANIMLTRDGGIKVVDFGVAWTADMAADEATPAAGDIAGTAQYLSPEQARGEQVDARSDLYSAGCLLYELLTGRQPFAGDDAVCLASHHAHEDPAAVSELRPSLPPSWN